MSMRPFICILVANVAAVTLPTISPRTLLIGTPPIHARPPLVPKHVRPPLVPKHTLDMGKVIDTLNRDHPVIFTEPPDLSIFSENVGLIGEGGTVRLKGKKAYARLFDSFRFARNSVGILGNSTSVSHRLVVCDGSVRLRWSAELWMQDPLHCDAALGLQMEPVHADGVSIYELDTHSGLIHSHRLENVVLTGPSALTELVVEALWQPALGGGFEGPVLAPHCSTCSRRLRF